MIGGGIWKRWRLMEMEEWVVDFDEIEGDDEVGGLWRCGRLYW